MRLPDYIWTRSVRKQMRHRRKEIQPVSCSTGYAGIRSEGKTGFVTVSSVIEAVDVSPLIRRVMAAGAEPVGLTGSLLLPEDTPEQELRSRVAALERACAEQGVEIMQLEVSHSRAVREAVMQLTLLGRRRPLPEEILSDRAGAGQMIVMSGWAGTEGMKCLLREERERLEQQFSAYYIRQAEHYAEIRLPQMECRLAAEYGVTAMQAAGEGGIYDALWQLGESTGRGMEVELYQIPVRQETVEIAELCEQDLYRMRAGGAYLMVTDRGEELVERLHQAQIPAAVIGRIRGDRDRVILFHEERRYLEPYR